MDKTACSRTEACVDLIDMQRAQGDAGALFQIRRSLCPKF